MPIANRESLCKLTNRHGVAGRGRMPPMRGRKGSGGSYRSSALGGSEDFQAPG